MANKYNFVHEVREIQIENQMKKKFRYDIVIAIIAIIEIILTYLENISQYKIQDLKSATIVEYRVIMLVLMLIGDIFIYLRCRCKDKILNFRQMENRRFWRSFLTTALLFSVQQLPYVQFTDPFFNSNAVLSSMSYIKVIFIFRVITDLSKFASEQSNRICQSTGVIVDYSLLFKLEIKDRPFRLLLVWLLSTTLTFGFLLQAYEQGSALSSKKDSWQKYDDISNAIWYVITTMTTVGYGDIAPLTKLGRLLAIISCFFGTFITSLITITTKLRLNLTPNEYNAFEFIKRQQKKSLLQNQAARVIQIMFKRIVVKRRLVRNKKYFQSTTKHSYQSLFRLNIRLDNELRRFHEIKFTMASSETASQKDVIQLIDQIREVKFDDIKFKLEQGLAQLNSQAITVLIQEEDRAIAKAKLTKYNNDKILDLFAKIEFKKISKVRFEELKAEVAKTDNTKKKRKVVKKRKLSTNFKKFKALDTLSEMEMAVMDNNQGYNNDDTLDKTQDEGDKTFHPMLRSEKREQNKSPNSVKAENIHLQQLILEKKKSIQQNLEKKYSHILRNNNINQSEINQKSLENHHQANNNSFSTKLSHDQTNLAQDRKEVEPKFIQSKFKNIKNSVINHNQIVNIHINGEEEWKVSEKNQYSIPNTPGLSRNYLESKIQRLKDLEEKLHLTSRRGSICNNSSILQSSFILQNQVQKSTTSNYSFQQQQPQQANNRPTLKIPDKSLPDDNVLQSNSTPLMKQSPDNRTILNRKALERIETNRYKDEQDFQQAVSKFEKQRIQKKVEPKSFENAFKSKLLKDFQKQQINQVMRVNPANEEQLGYNRRQNMNQFLQQMYKR